MRSPGLAWVLVDGRPLHVSTFAQLAPRRRPAVVCPQCGRRLTLKLGRILRHHAAHAPLDRCAATQPETALHLDLKFQIASALRVTAADRLPLVIRRWCAGTGAEHCDVAQDHHWLSGWDEVVVETRIDSSTGARPDILLRQAGKPVAAIEIRVSHAVDEIKAIALRAAGLRWIEVLGDAAMLSASPWTAARPIPVACEGDADAWGPWRCPRHAAVHQALVADARARQVADAESARYRQELRAARVVDFYHPGGARDRLIYRVESHFVDGLLSALVLRSGTREIARVPANEPVDGIRAAHASLRDAYADDVERLTLAGAFTDSPMRWASGDAAANIVYEALFDLAPGDPMPLATRYPRRWFYDRERGRWFLPRETRTVRWDRADPDAFAAHPAWGESRRRVRERPAPEYAVNAIVFAARPAAHSFGATLRLTQRGSIAVLDLEGLDQRKGRVLVVLTAATRDDEIMQIEYSLNAAGAEHVWLSHPRDWTTARAALAWAPAGCDSKGRGVVVVDGVGVYRAEEFARLFARGDRRVSVQSIRARSALRIAALPQSVDGRSVLR